jgi:transposase-like protein
MNRPSLDRQADVVKVLCEGNSIRSIVRITNIVINIVVKLLRDAGAACAESQNDTSPEAVGRSDNCVRALPFMRCAE